jgi:hypothetical protein
MNILYKKEKLFLSYLVFHFLSILWGATGFAQNGMVVSANHLASEEVELFLFPQFSVPLTNILL